jgi:hypothetical protein
MRAGAPRLSDAMLGPRPTSASEWNWGRNEGSTRTTAAIDAQPSFAFPYRPHLALH